MTTIAANRKCVAGDYKVTDGELVYRTPKVFHIAGAVVGVCGTTNSTNKWLTWFRAGCPPDAPNLEDDGKEDPDFRALVLDKDGLYLYSGCFVPDKLRDEYFAVGSGAIAAMTAMKCFGASPAEAVNAASEVCESTGEGVQVEFLPTPQPKGRTRAKKGA